jgi:hypothetical protein
VNRRGRLAGNVADGSRHDASRLADLARPLVERLPDRRDGRFVLHPDVEDDLLGADRLGGQDGPVDHEMRPARHQDPILGARRFAFGAVRDDDGPPVAALSHGPPLASHREAGTTPTEQPARLEVGDEIAAPEAARQGADPGHVSAEGLRVAVQGRAGQQSLGCLLRDQGLFRSMLSRSGSRSRPAPVLA